MPTPRYIVYLVILFLVGVLSAITFAFSPIGGCMGFGTMWISMPWGEKLKNKK